MTIASAIAQTQRVGQPDVQGAALDNFNPTTGEVVGAYVNEFWYGAGSGASLVDVLDKNVSDDEPIRSTG